MTDAPLDLAAQREEQIRAWEELHRGEQIGDILELTFVLGRLDEARAEIRRLRSEVERPDGSTRGHNEPCLMYQKPCDGFAGNPSLWPLRLSNDGWRHVGCVNDALHKLEGLTAPLAASAMERAKIILRAIWSTSVGNIGNVRAYKPDDLEAAFARAIEAAEAAARAQALHEALAIARVSLPTTWDWVVQAIRALADKSQTD